MKIEVGKRYVTADMHIFDIVAKTDISKSLLRETTVFIGIYEGKIPPFSMLFYENGSPFTAPSNYTLISRDDEFTPSVPQSFYQYLYPNPQPGEVWKTRGGTKILLIALNYYTKPYAALIGIIIDYPGQSTIGRTIYFYEDGKSEVDKKESLWDLVKKCKNQSYDKSKIILPESVKEKSA